MPDRNPGDKAVHVQKRPSTHRRCSWDGGKGKKTDFKSSVLQAAFRDHLLALRTCNTQPRVPHGSNTITNTAMIFLGVGSWMRPVVAEAMTKASEEWYCIAQ